MLVSFQGQFDTPGKRDPVEKLSASAWLVVLSMENSLNY